MKQQKVAVQEGEPRTEFTQDRSLGTVIVCAPGKKAVTRPTRDPLSLFEGPCSRYSKPSVAVNEPMYGRQQPSVDMQHMSRSAAAVAAIQARPTPGAAATSRGAGQSAPPLRRHPGGPPPVPDRPCRPEREAGP